MSTITMRYKPKHFVNYHLPTLEYYGFSWKVKYHRNTTVTTNSILKGRRALSKFPEPSVNYQYSPYGGAVEVELFYAKRSLGKVVEVCDNKDIFVKKIGLYNAITKIILKHIPRNQYIYVPNILSPKNLPVLDRAKTVHSFIQRMCD